MITQDRMIELAQGQLDAYNARNTEQFCSYYHEQVEAFELNGEKQETQLICRGKEQFRQIYDKKFKATPELYCELTHRIVTKFSVIDEEHVIVEKNKPRVHAVAIYEFKDNLIYRIHFVK